MTLFVIHLHVSEIHLLSKNTTRRTNVYSR